MSSVKLIEILVKKDKIIYLFEEAWTTTNETVVDYEEADLFYWWSEDYIL